PIVCFMRSHLSVESILCFDDEALIGKVNPDVKCNQNGAPAGSAYRSPPAGRGSTWGPGWSNRSAHLRAWDELRELLVLRQDRALDDRREGSVARRSAGATFQRRSRRADGRATEASGVHCEQPIAKRL